MEVRVVEKFQKSKKAQNRSQNCPNLLWTCFGASFPKKKFRPVFHGWSSLRKFSKKTKKVSKFQKCQKSFPKESKRDLNMLWGNFRNFFAQCSMQGFSDFLDLKIWVQFPERILNRHFVCIHATVIIRNPFPDFLDLKLWVRIPELKTMCSVFWTETIWNRFSGLKFRGRYLEKIQEKDQEGFKFLKLSKIVLKCPNVFWGIFFEKKFSPVFHGSSSRRKISKIQKGPKSFTKLSKLALNMFWGKFSEKKVSPSVPWMVEPSKIFEKKQKSFKIPKVPKIVPKRVQTCFEHALGRFFGFFFAQCSKQGFSDFLDLKTWVQFYETILNRHSFCIHATVNIRNPFPDFLDLKLWVQIPELKTMCSVFWTETIWNRFSGLKIRGRYLEKIQEKNQEGFRLLKLSKIVLKCPNVFWSIFFEKKIFPSVPWKFESSKNFKNPKRPKIVHKIVQTCFEHVLGQVFRKKSFAQCSMDGRAFENFRKNQKSFKIPKVPKIVPKRVQMCFEHALGRFFGNFFAQCSKQGFSDFLDLKTWVQFSERILNRHFVCIHATFIIRNPFPDFLDLKLWVRIPEHKTMCSVFWTETIWNRFSGLKIRGRYLEKIQEKDQEGFKFLKLSKIVLKCPNVFWGIFFEKKFSPVFHGSSSRRKISKIQKGPKSFTKLSKLALNMFWGKFSEKKVSPSVPWMVEPSKIFEKNQKSFKIPKVPKIVPKRVQTCFEHALGRFFGNFFAQCSKQGFSDFLDLKTWVQFYETILNRHFFCIHATVNIRSPFPDFLDLKLWVQIPELKTMCSVFWTETIWNRFSGLKIRGRYLEKIQEKNQEGFRLLKLSKIVLKCPNVFWSIFFEKKIFPSVPWKFESSKNFKNPKKPKIVHKIFQTGFEHVLGHFFRKKKFRPVFHGWSSLR